jgi:4,5-dihydroxyphthalate decarboxylase
MHLIAMRRAVLRDNPWAARNLVNAFEESKRRAVERLLDPAVSRYPLAWLPQYAERMRRDFGGDPFPFGIDANRATLEQMALYTHQQGIAKRRLTPEELFPEGVMTKVVV